MANFGDILSNISLSALQSVRRNAANDSFEAFTPGAGSSGDVVGPASSVSGKLASFSGTTGKLIADSGYAPTDFVTTAYSGLVPVGGIIMWSGTVATIPSNWHLCDGAASTPDLRDKFIVGAKQDDSGVAKTNLTGSLTQSGGSASHHHANHTVTQPDNHSAHTHSVTSNVAVDNHAAHTHSYTEIVQHTHAVNVGSANDTSTVTGAGNYFAGTTNSVAATAANPAGSVASGTTGNPSATLTHGVTNNAVTSGNPSATLTHSGTAVDAHDTLSAPQPYYALAFIMRTA